MYTLFAINGSSAERSSFAACRMADAAVSDSRWTKSRRCLAGFSGAFPRRFVPWADIAGLVERYCSHIDVKVRASPSGELSGIPETITFFRRRSLSFKDLAINETT